MVTNRAKHHIFKPLEIIFNASRREGVFPSDWKRVHVVLIHKKGHHQNASNYGPVSLLLVLSKVFERLIYNAMFRYFLKNELISPNQSGFQPEDSCIN